AERSFSSWPGPKRLPIWTRSWTRRRRCCPVASTRSRFRRGLTAFPTIARNPKQNNRKLRKGQEGRHHLLQNNLGQTQSEGVHHGPGIRRNQSGDIRGRRRGAAPSASRRRSFLFFHKLAGRFHPQGSGNDLAFEGD